MHPTVNRGGVTYNSRSGSLKRRRGKDKKEEKEMKKGESLFVRDLRDRVSYRSLKTEARLAIQGLGFRFIILHPFKLCSSSSVGDFVPPCSRETHT